MDISFQIYSARNFQPYEDVLAQVASLGYTHIEGFRGVYDDPAAFRAALDKNGLTMPTGHFAIDLLEDDFPAAAKIAETLGVKTIICPFLPKPDRPTDVAGWTAFAKRLEAVAQKCKAAGYGIAWHNHDFEFATLEDGRTIQKVLLDEAPGIGWEIDVAWVVRGGADPLAWIAAYGPRIVAAHVKDIAPAGENTDEDGWADVGHGTLDWPALMEALRTKTKATVFVMEHDNPSDVGRFARRSIDALEAVA